MTLSEVSKEVVLRFGAETLRSDRFFNLLDDFGGFRSYPIDYKIMVRDMLDSGFGLLMHDELVTPGAVSDDMLRDCLERYVAKSRVPVTKVEDAAEQVIAGLQLTRLLPLRLSRPAAPASTELTPTPLTPPAFTSGTSASSTSTR